MALSVRGVISMKRHARSRGSGSISGLPAPMITASTNRVSSTTLPGAAVEISFEERKYLVVPQAAILVLIRDDLPI